MDFHGRHQHVADDHRGADRREQTEHQEKSTEYFRACLEPRPRRCGPQAQLCDIVGPFRETVAAEPPQRLLQTVSDEERSNDDADKEKAFVHVDRPGTFADRRPWSGPRLNRAHGFLLSRREGSRATDALIRNARPPRADVTNRSRPRYGLMAPHHLALRPR